MTGFILSFIAYILFIPMAIVNFFTVLYKNVKVHGFLKTMNKYWFTNALEIDIWSNYHFRTTWNTFLRKKGGYKFGKKRETISSALGKNQRDKTLSIPGWILCIILYIIDFKAWKKGGHCIASINNNV